MNGKSTGLMTTPQSVTSCHGFKVGDKLSPTLCLAGGVK
jgi:hypothetical protein